MPAPIDVAKSIKAGARAAAPAITKTLSKATAAGTAQGFMSSVGIFRSLWGLVITAMIVSTVKTMIAAMMPAIKYIRATGTTTGEYGQFSKQMTEFGAVWENLKVQFGLMVISVGDLVSTVGEIIPLMIKLSELFSYIADNEIFKMVAKTMLTPVMFNPWLLKAWNWATDKMGVGNGWGGKELPKKLDDNLPGAKVAGAAMEGSVEAYRTIQGTMMRYAAETAKNTKVAADALQKIMQRAPEMGVVAG